jgi:hypothetical protein
MGNSQPKYLNSDEAMYIMGDKAWERLRRQLRGHGAAGQQRHSMDYSFFSRIIQSHFEYMARFFRIHAYVIS